MGSPNNPPYFMQNRKKNEIRSHKNAYMQRENEYSAKTILLKDQKSKFFFVN